MKLQKGTTSSYTATAKESKNGWLFRCDVTRNGVTETSDEAELVFTKLITKQPEDVTVNKEQEVTFTVEADADSYQWYVSKDGGKSWVKMRHTTNICTATAKESKNGWLFHCVVTKGDVTVTSSDAKLIYVK